MQKTPLIQEKSNKYQQLEEEKSELEASQYELEEEEAYMEDITKLQEKIKKSTGYNVKLVEDYFRKNREILSLAGRTTMYSRSDCLQVVNQPCINSNC